MTSPPSNIVMVPDFAECHAAVRELLTQPDPTFLARIGGSDTDVVIEYADLLARHGPEEALRLITPVFSKVRRHNGYYDKLEDDSKIATFCDYLTGIYQQCPELLVVGASLLTELMPETINSNYLKDTAGVRQAIHAYIAEIGARQGMARFYSYTYVERLLRGPYTLLRLFSEILVGKRVLVITPFSESIELNYPNRHAFFPNYNYPEFDLLTYNAPITYSGLPDEFYPDIDWFATVDRMKTEISAIDFDIALLSCGSYAMPLGLHIRDVMKGKAVYVGGCLQLLFGVTGRRYENPFFNEQINRPAFILPVERERFLPHVEVGPKAAKEAFGAYF